MEINKIYGNQCESDNAFTRKARLLQSMYRVEIGEEWKNRSMLLHQTS